MHGRTYSNAGSGSYSSNPASSSSETATRHAGHGNYPSYSGHASNSTINYSHHYNSAITGSTAVGGTAGDEHSVVNNSALLRQQQSQWCSWCNWTAYQDSVTAIWVKTKARCLVPISHVFLESAYWRVFLLFGNFVLLFGSPIQMLLVPPAGDPFFDVLYTVVLVAFLVDMIFRAAAVPGYFGIHFHTLFPKQSSRQRNSSITSRTLSCCCGCLCCCWCCVPRHALCWPTMGSFLFWCDLASTLTLLYDISFTNPANFAMVKVNLDLTGLTAVRMYTRWCFSTF